LRSEKLTETYKRKCRTSNSSKFGIFCPIVNYFFLFIILNIQKLLVFVVFGQYQFRTCFTLTETLERVLFSTVNPLHNVNKTWQNDSEF
jgi:hypothetical protein